jgi:hypothetical protein
MKINNQRASIQAIFKEDQEDRSPHSVLKKYTDKVRLKIINKRDLQRIKELENILATNPVLRGIDFFRVAAIYEHSNSIAHINKAKKIAQKGMRLGYQPAKWLFAIATDKLLILRGRRQKFGTNIGKTPTGNWQILPCQSHTSDEERKLYNVLPLKKIERRLNYLNRNPNSSPLLERVGITRAR